MALAITLPTHFLKAHLDMTETGWRLDANQRACTLQAGVLTTMQKRLVCICVFRAFNIISSGEASISHNNTSYTYTDILWGPQKQRIGGEINDMWCSVQRGCFVHESACPNNYESGCWLAGKQAHTFGTVRQHSSMSSTILLNIAIFLLLCMLCSI